MARKKTPGTLDPAALKLKFEERRTELLEKTKRVGLPGNGHHGDIVDQSINAVDQAVALKCLEGMQRTIRRLDSIIDKIESGEFDGKCQDCGNLIQTARLLSENATDLSRCRDCAEKNEQRNSGGLAAAFA